MYAHKLGRKRFKVSDYIFHMVCSMWCGLIKIRIIPELQIPVFSNYFYSCIHGDVNSSVVVVKAAEYMLLRLCPCGSNDADVSVQISESKYYFYAVLYYSGILNEF